MKGVYIFKLVMVVLQQDNVEQNITIALLTVVEKGWGSYSVNEMTKSSTHR